MRSGNDYIPVRKPISWFFLILLSLFTFSGHFAIAQPATTIAVATAQFHVAKTPAKSLNFKRALLHISKKQVFNFPQSLELTLLHHRLFLTQLKQQTINNLRPRHLKFCMINVLKPASAEEPPLL